MTINELLERFGDWVRWLTPEEGAHLLRMVEEEPQERWVEYYRARAESRMSAARQEAVVVKYGFEDRPDWVKWLTDKEREKLADIFEPLDPEYRRLVRVAELRSRRAVIRVGLRGVSALVRRGVMAAKGRLPMLGR